MTGNVAAYVYGDGETCYVGGGVFDVYRKAGLSTAEALRPYTEAVYLFEHLSFKRSVKLGIGTLRNGAAEGFFCKKSALFKIAADADTDNDRRAGI